MGLEVSSERTDGVTLEGSKFHVCIRQPSAASRHPVPVVTLRPSRGDSSGRSLLSRLRVNEWLRLVCRQPSGGVMELVAEKIAQLLHHLSLGNESRSNLTLRHKKELEQSSARVKNGDLAGQERLNEMQIKLYDEEEAKRKAVLRYIHCVLTEAVAGPSDGALMLQDTQIADDEVHALSAGNCLSYLI